MYAKFERPKGVTIIAILTALNGVALFILGFLTTIVIGILSFSGLLMLLGFFYLVFAWGLWNLKRWAWWLSFVGYACGILLDFVLMFYDPFFAGSILVDIFMAGYLISVRVEFSGEGEYVITIDDAIDETKVFKRKTDEGDVQLVTPSPDETGGLKPLKPYSSEDVKLEEPQNKSP